MVPKRLADLVLELGDVAAIPAEGNAQRWKESNICFLLMHLPRRMVWVRCHQSGFLRLGHLGAVYSLPSELFSRYLRGTVAEPCPLVGIATPRMRMRFRERQLIIVIVGPRHIHTHRGDEDEIDRKSVV